VTLAQALKHIVTLHMADDGDMEAHIRDFTACKRRVEEHGVALTDIVYRTFFLISMPTTYQMTVTGSGRESIVRGMEEAQRPTQRRVVDDCIAHGKSSHKGRQKAGNSKSNLLCTHCQKKGHVESTCWAKYPHLKGGSKPTASGEARVAFLTMKTARKAHIGGHGGENGGNPKHRFVDSGASEHFTPHQHILIDYKTLNEPVEVNTAKGKLRGIGTGSVHLTVEGQDGPVPITLKEVLYVPGMDSNLLSSNALLEKGLEVSMHPVRGIDILLGNHIIARTVWRLKTVDGECALKAEALKTVGPKPTNPQPPKALSYEIWHRRFAHLGPWNLQKVEKLVEGMAIDSKTLPTEGYACEACISGSQTRNLSDAPMTRRTVPGDRIGIAPPRKYGFATKPYFGAVCYPTQIQF
jgi:gag-polypeptide of LTR copia-type